MLLHPGEDDEQSYESWRACTKIRAADPGTGIAHTLFPAAGACSNQQSKRDRPKAEGTVSTAEAFVELANADFSQEICQKLTGHASPEMNRRYTHHDIERLRSAVAIIPSLRN